MHMQQFDGLCFLSAKLRAAALQVPQANARDLTLLVAARARVRKLLWEMTHDVQFLPGMAGDGSGQILRSAE